MPQLMSAAGVKVTLPRRDRRMGAGVPHRPSLIGASAVTSASSPLSAAVQRALAASISAALQVSGSGGIGEALAVLRSGSGATISGCAVTAVTVLAARVPGFLGLGLTGGDDGFGGLRAGDAGEGAERNRQAKTESQHRRVSTFLKVRGHGRFRPEMGKSTVQVSSQSASVYRSKSVRLMMRCGSISSGRQSCARRCKRSADDGGWFRGAAGRTMC